MFAPSAPPSLCTRPTSTDSARAGAREALLETSRQEPANNARLTLAGTRHTIAGMQRDTLLTILDHVGGLQRDGSRFRVAEGHDLTVYLGQPGRAAAIDHVLCLTAADGHVELEARDRGTFYVAYDIVHALLHSPRKDRKGPGGVGF